MPDLLQDQGFPRPQLVAIQTHLKCWAQESAALQSSLAAPNFPGGRKAVQAVHREVGATILQLHQLWNPGDHGRRVRWCHADAAGTSRNGVRPDRLETVTKFLLNISKLRMTGGSVFASLPGASTQLPLARSSVSFL